MIGNEEYEISLLLLLDSYSVYMFCLHVLTSSHICVFSPYVVNNWHHMFRVPSI